MFAKKEKKPYIKREDFLEPFEKSDKIKGGIVFGVYLFLTVFGGSLLIRTGIPLIQENLTFFVYLIDFILVAALFGKMYFRSFKDIKEKDIEDAFIILGIFLILMIAVTIFLSMQWAWVSKIQIRKILKKGLRSAVLSKSLRL